MNIPALLIKSKRKNKNNTIRSGSEYDGSVIKASKRIKIIRAGVGVNDNENGFIKTV